jgi:hypothetical protein
MKSTRIVMAVELRLRRRAATYQHGEAAMAEPLGEAGTRHPANQHDRRRRVPRTKCHAGSSAPPYNRRSRATLPAKIIVADRPR